MHKLKEILQKYSGQDWKTLAFPVLLIYWAVQDACLKLPKLYEGKDIRKLVACGLKQEPLHQGFPAIKIFLYTLGA
jgi:hypothetical protein